MSRRSRKFRLAMEPLESRLALSASGPAFANLSSGIGEVQAPGEVARVRNLVRQENLAAHRHSTIIGLNAEPLDKSTLNPRIVGAQNAQGRPLPFRPGSPMIRPWHPFARGYAKVTQPGTIDVGVTGLDGTTGATEVANDLPGDLNGDGIVDLKDLELFQSAYLTTPQDAFYNPAADANRNGFVGIGDGQLLLRNLTPLTPPIPLDVALALAPGQFAHGTKQQNSGGITRLSKVTVVGRTTPGSLIFSDSGLGNFTFTGAVTYADADGNFSFNFTLKDELTTTGYLVMDPFGQQTTRLFPILRVR